MHRETAVLPDVVAVAGAGPVVRIAGVPDGVDQHSPGPQDPPYLPDQRFQLGRGQRHAEQHVRVHGVDRPVRQGQRFADVLGHGAHRQALGGGPRGQLFEADGTEIGSGHREALAGEVQRVPSVAGAELQDGPARREHRGGVLRRLRRPLAVHAGVVGVRPLPVLTLRPRQRLVHQPSPLLLRGRVNRPPRSVSGPTMVRTTSPPRIPARDRPAGPRPPHVTKQCRTR